jgi:hypothetical protein
MEITKLTKLIKLGTKYVVYLSKFTITLGVL